MVEYVPSTRTVPVELNCIECKNPPNLRPKLLYHRTRLMRFGQMVDDSLKLDPERCTAKVVSYSRKRSQVFGGPIQLVFKAIDVPNQVPMCYVVRKNPYDVGLQSWIKPSTATSNDLYQLARRKMRQDDNAEPELINAVLGVSGEEFRSECEVFSKGCMPLEALLAVEYWLHQGADTIKVDCHGGWGDEDFIALDGMYGTPHVEIMSAIDEAARYARLLGKPFSVRSCFSSMQWYDRMKMERVWCKLDSKALDSLSHGKWPKPDGVGYPPDKYKRCRCKWKEETKW